MKDSDYIPQGDSPFDEWQEGAAAYLNGHLADLGLTALDPDVIELNAAKAEWDADYPAHLAAHNSAKGARIGKDESRAAYERVFRRISRRIQADPGIEDAHRVGMGLTVRDGVRTRVPRPTTAPFLSSDTSGRQCIKIRFGDTGPPPHRAKPPGVLGCEIWVKVGGDAPVDLEECRFLALDTRSPYVAEFSGNEPGQTAHFIGRWVNRRGEAGPRSRTISATIPI